MQRPAQGCGMPLQLPSLQVSNIDIGNISVARFLVLQQIFCRQIYNMYVHTFFLFPQAALPPGQVTAGGGKPLNGERRQSGERLQRHSVVVERKWIQWLKLQEVERGAQGKTVCTVLYHQ